MSAPKIAVTDEPLPSGALLTRIKLNAPERCNSLDPQMVEELRDALGHARRQDSAFVALTAKGRHFSTGGDVAAFHASRDRAAYADTVVGPLQDIVRTMLQLPAIVVAGVQGACTGGSAGLLFASDLALLAENAFIQPFYTEVGFAPDGGWCALLPERVGAARALHIQLENRRLTAPMAVELGIAQETVPAAELERCLGDKIRRLDETGILHSMRATKRLVWDEPRIAAVSERLRAEQDSFRSLIGREETAAGMERFLDTL